MTSRLLVAAFILVSVTRIHAQQTTIGGAVKDANGAALPGVTVDLVGEGGVTRRGAVTDRQGQFLIAGLDSGVYSLSFALAGFTPLTQTNLAVRTGSLVDIGDVTLHVGTLAETVQQPGPRPRPRDMRAECLHGENETESERQRRVEALAAMRLIGSLLERVPVNPLGYPDWQTLARSKAVSDLRNGAGPGAELAQKMRWGDAEPLPGWALTYQRSQYRVRFILVDSRDPCGFSYDSDDLWGGHARILPLQ
jgi:hypothetical protein